MNIRHTLPLFALAFAFALPQTQAQTPEKEPTAEQIAAAEKAYAERMKELGAQTSGIGQIGSRAEIDIPNGYIFFPAKGAKEVMRSWGNLIGGNEDGLISHQEDQWSVLFEFDAVGYVKDDDKNELDAEKQLKAIRESEPALNEARKEAGLPPQHTIGYAVPPKYNDVTKNLEWAIKFTVEGTPGEQLNYHTKLLGRAGVMNVTLMCEPEQLDQISAEYQSLITKFRFTEGETYAEYRSGDKIAEYGLVGLLAGGSAFAASKMGLFSKLGVLFAKFSKLIIAGVVGLAVGVKKLFGGWGRKNDSQ